MRRSKKIYALTMTAAAAAVLGVVGPWTVPFGPIPFSFCTLFLYLTAGLLGPKRAVVATAVYVLMGAAGLPVFSGFMGGLGHLTGPTGGYIAGYLPLSAVCALSAKGYPARHWIYPAGMVLGTAVLYAMGTVWFCLQTDIGLTQSFAVCVLPFLPGDAIKIFAAILLLPALRDRLERSGLLKE